MVVLVEEKREAKEAIFVQSTATFIIIFVLKLSLFFAVFRTRHAFSLILAHFFSDGQIIVVSLSLVLIKLLAVFRSFPTFTLVLYFLFADGQIFMVALAFVLAPLPQSFHPFILWFAYGCLFHDLVSMRVRI